MCSNGVNTLQLRATIEQINEAVALTRRWTHRSYHSAENGLLPKTAGALQQVQSLLDEARALLDEAGELAEREGTAADTASVQLV
ncbi:MAG: hypothetical protein LBU07_01185 [Coriobacteriales bacterium]|jgi:hypothetical protein|nr:hypothetical protein [Coriobacteriales bacterium]